MFRRPQEEEGETAGEWQPQVPVSYAKAASGEMQKAKMPLKGEFHPLHLPY